MPIEDISISTGTATFKNTENPSQDQGDIDWSYDETSAGYIELSFNGLDVEGNTITENDLEGEIEGDINPTKVFWWIVDKAKDTLCPDCGAPQQ